MDADHPIGPAVAGHWYPAERDELARRVDRLLAVRGDQEGHSGRISALIAPHAGFDYSGAVAGRAFSALRGASIDRVAVVGPSHYFAFDGARVPGATRYRTPLGSIEIDRRAVTALIAGGGFEQDDRPFAREHSLEAELPFLQRCLDPGWLLVPVLVGSLVTPEAVSRLAEGLETLWTEGDVIVVSTDFTHFGARFDYVPFRDAVPERIEALDREAIDLLCRGDAPGFDGFLARTGATICGRNPLRGLLGAMTDGVSGSLTAYDTSGRITGDWTHTVSYASVVFRDAT